MKYFLFCLLLFANNCKSISPSAQITPPTTQKERTWKRPAIPYIDPTNEVLDTILQTTHFDFFAHPSSADMVVVKEIGATCEATLSAIQQFTNSKKKIAKVKYHIYPSAEEKALREYGMELASVDMEKDNVYVVFSPYFRGYTLQQENKLVLRQLLGTPSISALEEGLSNYFTKQWQQKGYDYWSKKLFQSNNLPPLSELLDEDVFQNESNLVMGAMAGTFIEFLIAHFDKAAFIKNYTTWTAADLMQLDEAWQVFLSTKYSTFSGSENSTIAPVHPKTIPYLKGFNFAHQGYQIFNGYGSKMAKQSLERLDSIGSNAVAIVPYSFMRDPKVPSHLLIKHRAGGENDEAVLFSHFEAQRLGMHTMLKPQIWIRDSWPGEVAMSSEENWAVFFDHYYRWIRHYSLLAEINGFDSFCIGVEFTKATLGNEQEWRKLIQQVRGIYSGSLTYAANWGEEFEQLKFWDALDFVGLNCYYPLSEKENPSKKELKKAFEEVVAKIEQVHQRYKKSIVFTEIGFRSVTATWKAPHEEALERAVDENAQAIAYNVVLEEIQDKNWCGGILWWKWPSNLDHHEVPNTLFTPMNKPAELVVEKWFKF